MTIQDNSTNPQSCTIAELCALYVASRTRIDVIRRYAGRYVYCAKDMGGGWIAYGLNVESGQLRDRVPEFRNVVARLLEYAADCEDSARREAEQERIAAADNRAPYLGNDAGADVWKFCQGLPRAMRASVLASWSVEA